LLGEKTLETILNRAARYFENVTSSNLDGIQLLISSAKQAKLQHLAHSIQSCFKHSLAASILAGSIMIQSFDSRDQSKG
jgi:hypothetical protein